MLQGYQVKQLIEQRYPELTDKIYPSFSTTVEDTSIIYFISTASGGYVGQDTLEIRCIHHVLFFIGLEITFLPITFALVVEL